MNHLTVRNLPPAVAKALEREKRAGGQSLNQTVIRLLSRALGLDPKRKRSNGLKRLAGTWTAQEHEAFEKVIAETCEQIDPDDWR